MVSAWGMRRFLIRQPRAALVRLTSGERTSDLLPKKNQSWSRMGETIAAMAPELVECLDSEGNLLRAIRPPHDGDPTDAPEPPTVLATDPETARITHFANLIHRAYEHTTNVAFARLIDLVERIDARSDAIEARLERTESAYRRVTQQQLTEALSQVEDEEHAAAEPSGDLQQLLMTFLQGHAQATQSPAPVPARSNGRKRP